MSLCAFCSCIPLKLFSTDRNKQCTIEHHPSYAELRTSGAAGCELCTLFLDAIQKQKSIAEGDRIYGTSTAEDGKVTVCSSKFDLQHVQFDYGTAGSFRGRVIPAEWHDLITSRSEVETDKEMAIVKYWLNDCQVNHPECGSNQSNFMPTRVVDVGLKEDQEPRLILTAGLELINRRYLALSHCWGLSVPSTATTTLSTISARLQGIPIAGLSRTFADFIGIARKLRVQYVWIDSLCIIQDSKEDWESEASQMASVYSNAYCTIAASSSADGNGGCRTNPERKPHGPVVLTFHEQDKDGNEVLQRVQVFSVFGVSLRFTNAAVLAQDPLNKRGWTFQERELSNCMLHYSEDTIRWECRSLKASLEFPWQDDNAFNSVQRIFDSQQITSQQVFNGAHPLSTEIQMRKDQKTWFEAVDRYTKRALTKQSDKLPALSGIARAIQSRTADRYLAGLWESNLIACLLWYSTWHPAGTNPTFDPSKPVPISHARQIEYTAPSWSWAAIDGHVNYESWIFTALDPEPMAGPNARIIPQILGAEVIPAGKDEYGQLKGGTLWVKGKLKPAFTRGEGFARQDREGVYDVHEGKMREIGMIKFDVPADSPLGQIKIILCLCLMPRAENFGDSVGIAIVSTGKSGEYRRVGLILLVKLEWWEGCTENAISLV